MLEIIPKGLILVLSSLIGECMAVFAHECNLDIKSKELDLSLQNLLFRKLVFWFQSQKRFSAKHGERQSLSCEECLMKFCL